MNQLLDLLLSNDLKETTHPSGNNNLNPVQDLNDVMTSKTANCVDIANIMHSLCSQSNVTHYLVLTKFSSSAQSEGHVYCIYEKHNSYRVFVFIPQLVGFIKVYKFIDYTLNDVIKNQEDMLREEIEQMLGEKTTTHTTILSNTTEWDKLAERKAIQKELLTLFN